MISKYNADPTGNWYCTEAEWQNEVTAYGICGKFVVNTTNNTVRLPKLGDKIYTNQINIGGFAPVLPFDASGSSYIPSSLSNGVFAGNVTEEEVGTRRFFQPGYGSQVPGSAVSNRTLITSIGANVSLFTDLSSSSGITNNPLICYYYIVVGTITKTDIEVDIDQVITDLNGKADKDLSNTNVPHIIDSYYDETTGDWYRKYSDGWIEQGGIYYKGSTIAGNNTITFLLPFTTTKYNFLAMPLHSSSSSSGIGADLYNSRTTTTTILAAGAAFMGYEWQACGY